LMMQNSFRHYFLLLIIFFIFDTPELSAQNRRVVRADQAFELKQYSEALGLYRRAYNRVRRKDRNEGNRVAYKAALCYRYLNDHRSAESWFRRVVRTNYPDPLSVLYFAESLMQNGKFDEALVQYTRYSELVPDDWRGKYGIESVAAAKTLNASPTPYEVEALRLFNSREDDLTPVFGDHRASSLIFASSRDDAVGRDADPWTGNKHTSFFIVYQDRAGNWSRPTLLDEGPVNTEFNEGAASLNASATRMYFTRCLRSPDVDMGCRIFVAERDGASWREPREIPLVSDSAITVGHPAISPDELELYFVSDMPGGMGGTDIWVARRRAPGDTFGEPENLGPEINTPGNEMFPYVREDGTLFFASDGHPGLGGLDIFMSQRKPGGWTEPENLGLPINSTGDDFGIVFYPGREQGFLSSNRPGSRGYDIYSFYLAPFLFTIQGVVVDEANDRPIRGADIQLIGSDGSFFQAETDQRGEFFFGQDRVMENTDYDLLVSRERYFSTRGRQSTRGAERSTDYVVNFKLEPIPDRAIPLPEILYEFARWELLPQFKDSLDGLVQTLKDNPSIVIELASHTDSRGTDQINDTLSQRRAQTVVDFLIAEGIEHERLHARGYGKRVPRTIERNIVREGFQFSAGTVLNEAYINGLPTEEHRDAAHQLNRRTEFRVLSDDFKPTEPTGTSPPGNQ
jgi:peptidoglycan-associated lipoprotein